MLVFVTLKRWCEMMCVTMCVVSGGASEENRGGAAEQQPLYGDPQWQHWTADWAGGKCTGTKRTRLASYFYLTTIFYFHWCLV